MVLMTVNLQLVLLDHSNAFDLIDHKILLRKQKVYGIRGFALSWFASYLANQTQCVCDTGNCMSNSVLITGGVPQCSILGPLLSLLYINDIVTSSELFKFIMFAVDTNLFLTNVSLDLLVSNVNIELAKSRAGLS